MYMSVCGRDRRDLIMTQVGQMFSFYISLACHKETNVIVVSKRSILKFSDM